MREIILNVSIGLLVIILAIAALAGLIFVLDRWGKQIFAVLGIILAVAFISYWIHQAGKSVREDFINRTKTKKRSY